MAGVVRESDFLSTAGLAAGEEGAWAPSVVSVEPLVTGEGRAPLRFTFASSCCGCGSG